VVWGEDVLSKFNRVSYAFGFAVQPTRPKSKMIQFEGLSFVDILFSRDVLLLLLYVGLALFFSFLCSVAEASLLSVTPGYVAGLRVKNPKRAELLRQLKGEKIDQALAAILTVNTIAHTVGAIVAGSKASVIFGDVWFGIFSAVMTLMILFLSEIVPKTLGALYWREVSGLTALYVKFLIKAMYPLLVMSELVTKWLAAR